MCVCVCDCVCVSVRVRAHAWVRAQPAEPFSPTALRPGLCRAVLLLHLVAGGTRGVPGRGQPGGPCHSPAALPRAVLPGLPAAPGPRGPPSGARCFAAAPHRLSPTAASSFPTAAQRERRQQGGGLWSPSLPHQRSVLSRVPGWCPAEVSPPASHSPAASRQDGALCLPSRATEVTAVTSLTKRLHSSTFQLHKPLLEEGKTGWPEDLRASLDVSCCVVPADNTWQCLHPLLGCVGLLPTALCCVLISPSSPAKPSPVSGPWIKLPR